MRQNRELDDRKLIVKRDKDINASKSVTMLLNHHRRSPDFFNAFETVAHEWTKFSQPSVTPGVFTFTSTCTLPGTGFYA